LDFDNFITSYQERLSKIFTEDRSELKLERGLPEKVYENIMDLSPLSVFIPSEFGGRGANTYEALRMLEASSYKSLALSLMMGINGALFLQPLANYGKEEVAREIFRRFLEEQAMGGLMITEPDYGSDALRMQTCYTYNKETGSYHVKGTKHWAGLTGEADYWLISARKECKGGNLGRDISFFIHDSRNGGIEVKELFPNLGLYMLPYGRNEIDITVDEDHKLKPKSIGVKMMLDILHRSRLQFPGMAMGFLRRLMDESIEHCRERFVGGQNLISYDQVKHRLVVLQSYFTVCSGMCHFTGDNVPLEKDTSGMDLEANTIKALVTDLMQRASQSLLQLTGAKGYRLDHIAGSAIVDSRPFQIFEGSNDILFQQITESIIKAMRKVDVFNLGEFLQNFRLSKQASAYLNDVVNFTLDPQMPQRKQVTLGKALSRIFSMEFVLRMGNNGFNSKLIDNAIDTMVSEINGIICSFENANTADVVSEYESKSSWIDYLSNNG